jgi:hypothetical protein
MPLKQEPEGLPDEAVAKPADSRPTREIGRLLSFYKKNIRDYTPTESVGVVRNIQRMIAKGLVFEDIVTALQNYAEDEWRKSQDPRRSMPIRTFFSEAKIREWLKPQGRTVPVAQKPALPEIAFTPIERPAPAIPLCSAEEDTYEL